MERQLIAGCSEPSRLRALDVVGGHTVEHNIGKQVDQGSQAELLHLEIGAVKQNAQIAGTEDLLP